MQITSAKEQRVIDICIQAGADIYLSGTGARVYQQEEHFTKQGLTLKYLDYKAIQYHQIWPKVGFMPNMSVFSTYFAKKYYLGFLCFADILLYIYIIVYGICNHIFTYILI